jgi:hypothetical protein
MARYGIVPRSEHINAMIFQGTPSQLINLPAFIKGAVAILAIGIGFGYCASANGWHSSNNNLRRWTRRDRQTYQHSRAGVVMRWRA